MTAEKRARVAVVTGASSGIGLVAAKTLAAAGWRVIGTGRNPERSAAALAEIRAVARDGNAVDMLRVDLSLMTEAARLARDVAARTDRLDVLLNNAGGPPAAQVVTPEGNEACFAGNHLGHFLLTDRLLPLLRAAAADQPRGAVRIINVSSNAHEYTPGLNWDDLQLLKNFGTGQAYINVKLANVLFTRALARRVAPYGIVAHSVHPGFVDTNFPNNGDARMQEHYRENKGKILSAVTGADTLIWLSVAPEAGETNGVYFFERAPGTVSAAGQDDAAAERLWVESEKLVARAGA